jgi:hypothetical protein
MTMQTPKKTCHDRGSAYIFVIIAAMVVAMMGLGALAVCRTQIRQATDTRDEQLARSLAFSAAEHALLAIDTTANWRTALKNQTITKSLNGGTLSWQLSDPNDGNLDNNSADPVRLTATGRRGLGRYVLAFDLTVHGGGGSQAMPVNVRSLIFGAVTIKKNAQLRLYDGTAMCDKNLDNSGDIYGNVQATSITGKGTVWGTVSTAPVTADPPSSAVVDAFIARATAIPFVKYFNDIVLAPGYNPYGQPNPDGVYYMNAGNQNMFIRHMRVNGTLIIRSTGKVTISGPVLMERARADYPALIVDGELEMDFDADGEDNLRENNDNFNPPGAPYGGQTDSDTDDRYPAQIRGLVHVTGPLTLRRTADIYGMVICDDAMTVFGKQDIYPDAVMDQNPPADYFSSAIEIRPTRCARVVN